MGKQTDGMPSVKPTGKLFTDEHGNAYSLELVNWEHVKFDPNMNVRPRSEFDTDKWGAVELVPALRETKGVPKTEPAFHLDTATGELTILRGNRRYLAISMLREENPKEPGYQTVMARIYRDLEPEKQAIVKMDHAAHEKPLSRFGLYNSIIEFKKIGYSEQKTIAAMRGALSDSYQEDRNPGKPNDAKEVFAQYRGFVRTCRWANDISALERAFIDKLKTPGKTFPTNDVIETCHKAFLAHKNGDTKLNIEANPLVTKDTLDSAPELVPTLTEAWTIAQEAEKVREAEGKVRTKGSTAVNPQQIKGLALKSIISNGIQAYVARKTKNQAAWPDVFDPLLLKLEKFMTDEDRDVVSIAVTGKPAPRSAVAVEKTEGVQQKKATSKKVSVKK